jgi:hypothetical protein
VGGVKVLCGSAGSLASLLKSAFCGIGRWQNRSTSKRGKEVNMADKIIFITGVSSGLGQALAEEALTQGWRVVGTVRSEEAQKNFEAEAPRRAIGRVLDVTDSARIPQVIAEVDVVFN